MYVNSIEKAKEVSIDIAEEKEKNEKPYHS